MKLALAFFSLISAFICTLSQLDGRAIRGSRRTKYAIRHNTWERVQESEEHHGWFKRHFRCSKATFLCIVQRVEQKWVKLYKRPYHNANFSIKDRVAVTLYYLTHSTTLSDAGLIFGMSKTSTERYVHQVINILLLYKAQTVCLPSNHNQWRKIASGFEEICGLPNVSGALDGSLFQIKRFADNQGWYCRKAFPAFNMLAVVDDRKRFMACSI